MCTQSVNLIVYYAHANAWRCFPDVWAASCIVSNLAVAAAGHNAQRELAAGTALAGHNAVTTNTWIWTLAVHAARQINRNREQSGGHIKGKHASAGAAACSPDAAAMKGREDIPYVYSDKYTTSTQHSDKYNNLSKLNSSKFQACLSDQMQSRAGYQLNNCNIAMYETDAGCRRTHPTLPSE